MVVAVVGMMLAVVFFDVAVAVVWVVVKVTAFVVVAVADYYAD